ncbi:FadR/GntR family transcriptional regulator [Jannaschia sp. M317]|uniref:FadR/GntR family transcriptional regulator n=1 Tax=Jannaschia sp. M317 TaxID=2867011 RepID=UPI0021A64526|nr:FCD domain-containing protein [Jannaschia sp. M317]UWQ16193.1 FCD domain-containing protein [Jannaschia sp. M317]
MSSVSPLPPRLYRQVADRVVAMILSEGLTTGTRLPPERELALRLGVARSTLREAMIALEIAGQVVIRTGSGIYVAEGAMPDPADLGAGPLELLDARELIEGEVAARAAQAMDAARLRAIETTVAAMAQATDRDSHRAADRAFHLALAEATGIDPLVRIVDDLWSQMFGPMFERMGTLTGLFGGDDDTALTHHRAILDALAARDGAVARARMQAHLVDVRRVLLRGPDREDRAIAGDGGAA